MNKYEFVCLDFRNNNLQLKHRTPPSVWMFDTWCGCQFCVDVRYFGMGVNSVWMSAPSVWMFDTTLNSFFEQLLQAAPSGSIVCQL